MRRAPFPLLTAALLVALAAPASAAESPLDQYQRTGTIDPCTPGLQGGGGAPNDVQQYAPDYLAALNEARRKGCHHGGSGSGNGNGTAVAGPAGGGGGSGPSGAPAGTPYVPKPPAPPKVVPTQTSPVAGATGHLPLAAKSDGGTPAPVIALAILFLLALVGAGVAAVGRWFGWRLGLMDPVRHAGGEAALRLGSAAGSLADWARETTRRGR